MKNALLSSVLLAVMPIVAQAAAGTCADPQPLPSNNMAISGTTCGGQAGINMGGTVYAHPSFVYSFVANNAAGQITVTGAEREMSLTTSCTTAPIAAGAPGAPISLAGLTNGQTYFLVVSSDPGLPVTNPARCGSLALTTGTLPVMLQSYSVD